MKRFSLLILILLISTTSTIASNCKSHLFYEKEYQKYWCQLNKGTMEYVLPDKTRVDCVTPSHAIEFDFAKKWAESVGQALYYGEILNKTPAIVLIIENPEQDLKYYKRVSTIAQAQGIQLWTITPEDITK